MSAPLLPVQASTPVPSPVPSPCISLCRMDEARGLCQGCLRSIDEIIAWGRADEAYKRGVWLAIAERAKNAST
jgi:predicted Fe-S protein YdhL (DUF1289 family)